MVDRERARQLLAAAGGQSGGPLRLAFAEVNAAVAEHLMTDLAEIGLEVEAETLPYEVFYRRVEEASCDLFLFNWTYRVADASKFLDTFVRSRDPVRGFGTFNGAALADPEIDQLIESAVIEPVSSARLEKLQEAVAMVGEQLCLPSALQTLQPRPGAGRGGAQDPGPADAASAGLPSGAIGLAAHGRSEIADPCRQPEWPTDLTPLRHGRARRQARCGYRGRSLRRATERGRSGRGRREGPSRPLPGLA